jgi:type IV pilus assembly protein PilX
MSLLVGLVFLIVLTLIATAAMRMALLDERMAGFAREQNIAFQAAESTLRAAESSIASQSVSALSSFTAACSGGLCLSARTGPPRWETVDWSASAGVTRALTTTAQLVGVDTAPRYLIEFLGGDDCGGGGRPGAEVLVTYRVTARAESRGGARREVQSRYEKYESTC